MGFCAFLKIVIECLLCEYSFITIKYLCEIQFYVLFKIHNVSMICLA